MSRVRENSFYIFLLHLECKFISKKPPFKGGFLTLINTGETVRKEMAFLLVRKPNIRKPTDNLIFVLIVKKFRYERPNSDTVSGQDKL